MSVLIRGATMPNCCEICPCNDDMYACGALNRPFGDFLHLDEGRLPDCPLLEVPPHGRLIDADVILDNLDGLDILGKITVAFARFVVKDAPTVIESEEE